MPNINWAYRLCLTCGKIECLGEKEQLEEETERVFVPWQACGSTKEKVTHLSDLTIDMYMSLEDPALCEDCWKEYVNGK
jgi:hypothetical protein